MHLDLTGEARVAVPRRTDGQIQAAVAVEVTASQGPAERDVFGRAVEGEDRIEARRAADILDPATTSAKLSIEYGPGIGPSVSMSTEK